MTDSRKATRGRVPRREMRIGKRPITMYMWGRGSRLGFLAVRHYGGRS